MYHDNIFMTLISFLSVYNEEVLHLLKIENKSGVLFLYNRNKLLQMSCRVLCL